MSLSDYQQGAAFTAGRSSAAIGEWEAHANSLKQRLRQAHSHAENLEASLAKAHASRFGLAQLVRTLSAELRRLDPQNPLLQIDRQLSIVESVTAEKAAERGYAYDSETGAINPFSR